MRKLFLILLSVFVLLSCAESKTFKKQDGSTFVAEPYGWANYQTKKIDGVKYECCIENVFWSVAGLETLVVPVYLSGWALYEPVEYVETKQ